MLRPRPREDRRSHNLVLDLYAPTFLLIQDFRRYRRLLVRRLIGEPRHRMTKAKIRAKSQRRRGVQWRASRRGECLKLHRYLLMSPRGKEYDGSCDEAAESGVLVSTASLILRVLKDRKSMSPMNAEKLVYSERHGPW